jgi:hypothetical protein
MAEETVKVEAGQGGGGGGGTSMSAGGGFGSPQTVKPRTVKPRAAEPEPAPEPEIMSAEQTARPLPPCANCRDRAEESASLAERLGALEDAHRTLAKGIVTLAVAAVVAYLLSKAEPKD